MYFIFFLLFELPKCIIYTYGRYNGTINNYIVINDILNKKKNSIKYDNYVFNQ